MESRKLTLKKAPSPSIFKITSIMRYIFSLFLLWIGWIEIVAAETSHTSPFSLEGAWEQVGGNGILGSWTSPTIDKVRALEVYNDRLYHDELCAGLGGTKLSDGQIWCFDGKKWEQIGGNGIRASWGDHKRRVNSLLFYEGFLYAGLGDLAGSAEVWRFDGIHWHWYGGQGSGVGGTWIRAYDIAYSMALYQGDLHVGLFADSPNLQTAPVFRLHESTWSRIAGEGEHNSWAPQHTYQGTYVLHAHQGYLYAGLTGRKPDLADIWRFNGKTWEQVGGDGLNGSWNADPEASDSYVESMASYQGKLVVSLSKPRYSNFWPIWEFDGKVWKKLGTEQGMPSIWHRAEIFNHLFVYNDVLLMGIGGLGGVISLWEFNNNHWRIVGGFGVYDSWGKKFGYVRGRNSEWVYRIASYRGDLFIGMAGADAKMGQVWRYKKKNNVN